MTLNTTLTNANTGLADSVTVVTADNYIRIKTDMWRNSKVVQQAAIFIDLYIYVERTEQQRDVRPRTV